MSTVFRVQKNANYTTMSNYHLKDRRLSYKAKGLLSVILSLPDEWDYSLKGLAYISGDGIDSVRGGIRELENFGYISRGEQTRDELGRMSSNEYFVYENPDQNPYFQPPTTGNPTSDTNTKSKTNSGVNGDCKTRNAVVKPNSTALENPTRLDSQTSDVVTALDFPSSENPLTDNPSTENPTTGTLFNNKILTNQVLNNQSNPSSLLPKTNVLGDGIDEIDRTYSSERNYSFSDLKGKKSLPAHNDRKNCRELIRKNINYDYFYENRLSPCSPDIKRIDELVSIMTDVVCSSSSTIRVNGTEMPLETVKSRFLELRYEHIDYVLDALKRAAPDIRNIRAYLITALYNSADTENNYYSSMAEHDIAAGKI